MINKKLVIGYTWKGGAIYLQVRELSTDSKTTDIEICGEFYLRKKDERHCIGWIDFSVLEIKPCPSVAQVKKYQCDRCKEKEGFLQCVMCNGFSCPRLNPAVEAYCRQTHHLYLACFGDNNIKVGTTSTIRKYVRLLEQGPLAASYVATAPGPIIKQIEYYTSSLGYTEMMKRRKKRQLLTSEMSEMTAIGLIQNSYIDITSRIPEVYQTYFHEPEKFIRPTLSIESRKFKELDEVIIDVGSIVGGRVLAANGHIVVVDDGTGPTTLDISSLKGCVVELNPEGQKKRRAKQLSLFDQLS